MMHIAVIGAGAAGCFCAAELGRLCPDARITVYESARKPLAKVAVTGGGRCNLTNSFEGISIDKAYPRGARLMKRLLAEFSQTDCMEWFSSRGVELVIQDDGCVFPRSQDAMQIVGTLLGEMKKYGVSLKTGHRVSGIIPGVKGFSLLSDGKPAESADKVVITVGGLSSAAMAGIFDTLDLNIEKCVPSLFTFKLDSPVTALSGIVVEQAKVRLDGTKYSSEGPLLITDWGFSGPAALKLSSYGARHLAECGYKAGITVSWLPGCSEKELMNVLSGYISDSPAKMVSSLHPGAIPGRLWDFLLDKANIKKITKFAQLGGKSMRRLCATLLSDSYKCVGRSKFKEEFVTCGGISLDEIDLRKMESKKYKGLYFAGEVLDIDAITGGFNLQAAWSGAHCAARAIATETLEG